MYTLRVAQQREKDPSMKKSWPLEEEEMEIIGTKYEEILAFGGRRDGDHRTQEITRQRR